MARKKANSDLPSFDELIIPTVRLLKNLVVQAPLKKLIIRFMKLQKFRTTFYKFRTVTKKGQQSKLTIDLLGVELI